MNRREATQHLSLLVAAAMVGPHARSASAGELNDGASPLCAVIYDGRYSDARRFAESLGDRAAMRLATTGETIGLWDRDCRPRLVNRKWRFAGMTTYSDFVLLRSCARECGGTILYEGLHDYRHPAKIVHAVRPARLAETLGRTLRGADWTAFLSQALACTRLHALSGNERTGYAESGGAALEHPSTLVSWIIGCKEV
jgi:hypothetical protein